MKKAETKKILFNELKPFFAEREYKLDSGKFSGFIKKSKSDVNWIFFDSRDYNSCQRIFYSVNKRVKVIDEVWQEVDKLYFNKERENLDFAYTLSFSYESINGINNVGYLPDIYTKDDVHVSAKFVEEFMVTSGFSLLDKFENIEEIDSYINGEHFWESDWKKPIRLGFFAFHRTIIAFLCSNPKLNEIKQYHLKYWEDNLKEYPDCQNLINAYQYLLNLLMEGR